MYVKNVFCILWFSKHKKTQYSRHLKQMTLMQACGVFSMLQFMISFLIVPYEVMLVDSTNTSSITSVLTPMENIQLCRQVKRVIVELQLGSRNVSFINDSCGDQCGVWSSEGTLEKPLFNFVAAVGCSLLLGTLSVLYASIYVTIFIFLPIFGCKLVLFDKKNVVTLFCNGLIWCSRLDVNESLTLTFAMLCKGILTVDSRWIRCILYLAMLDSVSAVGWGTNDGEMLLSSVAAVSSVIGLTTVLLFEVNKISLATKKMSFHYM
jgi:hypothetical protein